MNDYIEVDYSEAEEALEHAAENLQEAGYETKFTVTNYADNFETASEERTDEALEEFFNELGGQISMQVMATPDEQEHPDDTVYVQLSNDGKNDYSVSHASGNPRRTGEVEELL